MLSLSLFLLFLFSLHSSSYFLPFILYHIMPILSLPFSSSLFLLSFSLHPSSSSHFFFLYHIMFILPHLILFPFPHSSSSLSCHIILYYAMPCHFILADRAPSVLNGGLTNEWILGTGVFSLVLGAILEIKGMELVSCCGTNIRKQYITLYSTILCDRILFNTI